MSQQAISLLDMAFVASGAVTYGRAVNVIAPTVRGARTAAQVSTSGGKAVGIARRSADSGETFEATVMGSAVCEAGAAVSVGARVMADATGRVVPATALTASAGTLAIAAGATAVTSTAANGAGTVTGAPTLSGGDTPLFVFGTALEAAAAAGDYIEVLFGN